MAVISTLAVPYRTCYLERNMFGSIDNWIAGSGVDHVSYLMRFPLGSCTIRLFLLEEKKAKTEAEKRIGTVAEHKVQSIRQHL